MPERLLLAKMNRPSSLYPKQLVEKKHITKSSLVANENNMCTCSIT